MTEERAPYRVWPPRPGARSLRAMLDVQAYWRKYRPTLYADLQRRGLLEQAIDEAIQRSVEAVEKLLAGGTPLERAWQLVHDLWVFLPPEAGTETAPPLPSADGAPIGELRARMALEESVEARGKGHPKRARRIW